MSVSTSGRGRISNDDYFDRLVLLAAAVCDTPIALANYIANGWQNNVMSVGFRPKPMPVEDTICVHTVEYGDLFVIPDTHEDERFRDQLYVTGPPHIRFYAGMPIFRADGQAHGTLCVLDRVPRQLSHVQTANLRQLAKLLSACLKDRAA